MFSCLNRQFCLFLVWVTKELYFRYGPGTPYRVLRAALLEQPGRSSLCTQQTDSGTSWCSTHQSTCTLEQVFSGQDWLVPRCVSLTFSWMLGHRNFVSFRISIKSLCEGLMAQIFLLGNNERFLSGSMLWSSMWRAFTVNTVIIRRQITFQRYFDVEDY